jgi:hypothetical protein
MSKKPRVVRVSVKKARELEKIRKSEKVREFKEGIVNAFKNLGILVPDSVIYFGIQDFFI